MGSKAKSALLVGLAAAVGSYIVVAVEDALPASTSERLVRVIPLSLAFGIMAGVATYVGFIHLGRAAA